MEHDPTLLGLGASGWVAVAFIIFVIAAIKPVVSKVGGMLDVKSAAIGAQLKEAEALREEAQAALANYQRLQRDALKEAEDIVAHAKEEAARIRKDAKQHLTETLKRREEQAAEKIARAEAQALQDVRNQAVELAMVATGNLLAEKMTAEVNDKIVKNAVADLPARLQ
ncbi:F0F1 ATP synthase subunit B [uncultured Nisaea sp.]|jgi:F-type H+-transporting ATPase subunit b|uniref:F0F1 ATP synthase subunit B family protein n=1 Tax=uncultured Nisaea sp. TaxID=538215 RepID=UPI0030EF722D|tara:strand:- start:242 stop:745 length:504 start_codon:yes stop_codon:yes gene_type:complete